MSWLALGDSSARDDLQRRMRVSCSRGQIRDCCFCRAAAVTSSLDNLRAAAPCVRLLFMAPVAIGSSGWRTTAAACARLHYIACDARRQLQLVRKHLAAASTPGGCICSWRLLLLLAAASAPGGRFCKRLPAAPPDRWQQHHRASSTT
ncbi:unnamed protein product [Closterium sp. NIES-64]|nr:unnamed protein product [Closterium sp. NIES-64]